MSNSQRTGPVVVAQVLAPEQGVQQQLQLPSRNMAKELKSCAEFTLCAASFISFVTGYAKSLSGVMYCLKG